MKKTYKIIMISLIAVIVLGIGIVVGNSWHTKTQQPKVSTTTITNNTAKGEASKEEKEAFDKENEATKITQDDKGEHKFKFSLFKRNKMINDLGGKEDEQE